MTAPALPAGLAPQRPLPVTLFFACLIVMTLPFAQLFTVDVGFALKIYEVAILLWLPCAVVEGFPIFRKKIFLTGILFVAYAILALWINLDILQKKESYAMWARFSPFLDGLLKSGYALLCIFGCSIVALGASRNPRKVAHAWLLGASICAVLQLVLALITFAGQSLPALPGMPNVPQYISVFGHRIYRAATFIEANMAGPYLVLSMLIAFVFQRKLLALLFLAALATTFSTSAFSGLVVAGGYLFLVSKKTNFSFLLSVLAGILIVAVLFPVIDFVIFDKLADIRADSSVGDRLFKGIGGLEMFFENPLLGIGLSQFGLCFYDYTSWVQSLQMDIGHGMTDKKVIANVVYIEILAETGAIGTALMAILITDLTRMAMHNTSTYLRAGIIAIFVFWIACSTFTIMYFWVFFGFVAGMARQQAKAMAA